MMDNDDVRIGRLLTRREGLRLLALAGLGLTIGAACESAPNEVSGDSASAVGQITSQFASGGVAQSTSAVTTATQSLPACVVRPEMTVGPYFVDQQLNRSDVRGEPSDGSVTEGLPLALSFNVLALSAEGCVPLPGAMVDIWQCDARGIYSGVRDPNANTVGLQFLRGYQETDAAGVAQFTTIYPGWYRGRTVHIHFKIRTTAPSGDAYEFTSQLFFDDALSDRVLAQPPYAGRGVRDTTNARDGIFRDGGEQLTLDPVSDGAGLAATFAIALDLNDTATGRPERSDGPGGPGGPSGGPGGRRP